MELPVKYITLPKPKGNYKKTAGLSEQLVLRKLKKQGYTVTRGSMLDCFFLQTGFDESKPARTVRKKLVDVLGVETCLRIAKYCAKNHGTPDYLIYHPAKGIVGVEVKLGQEAIAPHQLRTMKYLLQHFACEVWRVAPKRNVVRQKQINLSEWEVAGKREATRTVEKDLRLTKKRYG